MELVEFKAKFKKGNLIVFGEKWMCILCEASPSFTIGGEPKNVIVYYLLSKLKEDYFVIPPVARTGIGYIESYGNKIRLANNIEKKMFYDRLKTRGYKWNEDELTYMRI